MAIVDSGCHCSPEGRSSVFICETLSALLRRRRRVVAPRWDALDDGSMKSGVAPECFECVGEQRLDGFDLFDGPFG